MMANDMDKSITKILTLGPAGTNCEAAANYYIKSNGMDADVELYNTLEEAAKIVSENTKGYALLGCIVYPDLHQLCFPYLGKMKLQDVFIHDTYNMVLASRHKDQDVKIVATHPAPKSLVPSKYKTVTSNSNTHAGIMCKRGDTDACITTSKSAENEGLHIIKDYGPVPMGFSIHVAA